MVGGGGALTDGADGLTGLGVQPSKRLRWIALKWENLADHSGAIRVAHPWLAFPLSDERDLHQLHQPGSRWQKVGLVVDRTAKRVEV